ncbi:MAG: hypothetical protein ACREAN_01030 [Nitrosopumilaceae archaeon]
MFRRGKRSDLPDIVPEKLQNSINPWIILLIVGAIASFSIVDSMEPRDNTKFTFFDFSYLVSFGVAAVFGIFISKRYWGSKIFGKSYFSLSLGYASYFIGSLTWYIYAVIYQVQNPYPYYPDVAYFAFFPFIIYHLKRNIHYFKPKLEKKQKINLIIIPIGITLIFTFITLVPMDITDGILNLKILPTSDHDQSFYTTAVTSIAYVILDTLVLSCALVGVQIFRNSALGSAWGLLLGGITLYTIADLLYYHFMAFGIDVSTDVNGLWVGSAIIVCYSLYKHKSFL